MPYFHNGFVATSDEVIDFMRAGSLSGLHGAGVFAFLLVFLKALYSDVLIELVLPITFI